MYAFCSIALVVVSTFLLSYSLEVKQMDVMCTIISLLTDFGSQNAPPPKKKQQQQQQKHKTKN